MLLRRYKWRYTGEKTKAPVKTEDNTQESFEETNVSGDLTDTVEIETLTGESALHSGDDGYREESDGQLEDESFPFSDNEIELEEDSAAKKYTKTEINRMSTAELQNLAAAEGIENAFETSGNELKKILAEHFGL